MEVSKIILYLVILALFYPVALILAKYTKDEKKLYGWYFPAILWILAIAAAIFYTLNLVVALTLTFLFLVVLFWKSFGWRGGKR